MREIGYRLALRAGRRGEQVKLSGKPCFKSVVAESSGEEAKRFVSGSLSMPISCFGFDLAIFKRKLMLVDVSAACLKVQRDCCFAFCSAFLYICRASL